MTDVYIPEDALTADALHQIVKFAGVSGCIIDRGAEEQLARDQQNALAHLFGQETTHCNQPMRTYWLDWYDWDTSIEP